MGCMQSTPVAEPTAPPASKSVVVETKSAPASQHQQSVGTATDAAPEPEAETVPGSAKAAAFNVTGVSITEQGVVFYHIESEDGTVSIKRRFNDFKALYAQLGAVSSGLPALPESGLNTVLRGGRQSQELIDQRKVKFATIVNAVAGSPALAGSDAFQKFLSA